MTTCGRCWAPSCSGISSPPRRAPSVGTSTSVERAGAMPPSLPRGRPAAVGRPRAHRNDGGIRTAARDARRGARAHRARAPPAGRWSAPLGRGAGRGGRGGAGDRDGVRHDRLGSVRAARRRARRDGGRAARRDRRGRRPRRPAEHLGRADDVGARRRRDLRGLARGGRHGARARSAPSSVSRATSTSACTRPCLGSAPPRSASARPTEKP